MRTMALIAVLLAAVTVAAFDQRPGWPIVVPGNEFFWNQGGAVVADLDGDGAREIIVGTTAGKLHVWNSDGSARFAKTLTGMAQTPAAVGNLNAGSAGREIVIATRSITGGSPVPTVYIFASSGTILAERAFPGADAVDIPPTLIDADGDGESEIVLGERDGSTGYLHLVDKYLDPLAGWPVALDHVPATSAAVGDIDGDGADEIVVCSFHSLYAFETDGSVMAGFPVNFAGEDHSYGAPALADLNGDERPDILTVTHGDLNRVHAIDFHGDEIAGWPFDLGDAWSFSSPAVGDLDRDGTPEVAVGRSGGLVEAPALYVVDHDGAGWAAFPFIMEGGAEGNFVVADLTGDTDMEIVFTNNLVESEKGYLFMAGADGEIVSGWPLRPDGMTYLNGPVLTDLEDDGTPELVALASAEDGDAVVNVFTLDGYAIDPAASPWTTYQADNAHTGMYRPEGSDDDFDDDADDDLDDDSDDDADDDSGDDDTGEGVKSSDDDSTDSACGC